MYAGIDGTIGKVGMEVHAGRGGQGKHKTGGFSLQIQMQIQDELVITVQVVKRK